MSQLINNAIKDIDAQAFLLKGQRGEQDQKKYSALLPALQNLMTLRQQFTKRLITEEAANEKLNSILQNLEKTKEIIAQGNQIARIQGNVDDTRRLMEENIDHVEERGEKIENLVTKTAQLNDNSESFETDAMSLKETVTPDEKSTPFKVYLMNDLGRLIFGLICTITVVPVLVTYAIGSIIGAVRGDPLDVIKGITGYFFPHKYYKTTPELSYESEGKKAGQIVLIRDIAPQTHPHEAAVLEVGGTIKAIKPDSSETSRVNKKEGKDTPPSETP